MLSDQALNQFYKEVWFFSYLDLLSISKYTNILLILSLNLAKQISRPIWTKSYDRTRIFIMRKFQSEASSFMLT